MKFKDLVGRKFHHLTVISFSRRYKGVSRWTCRCDCGTIKEVPAYPLTHNLTKSCGCVAYKLVADAVKTHGESKTRFYHIWASMRARCSRPKCHAYERYGGRGISYDPSWDRFENFKKDMWEGYAETLTLERKNNNGNYTKENCVWIPLKAQARNRRNNKVIEAFGQKRSMAEWAEITELSYWAIAGRMRMGWDAERALSTYSRLDKNKHIKCPTPIPQS